MARSLIERRHEAERERIESYDATLRQVSTPRRPPPDLERALRDVGRGSPAIPVREPSSWRPRLKTRDGARLRLAAARHLFALYPVPAHLEAIWLDEMELDRHEVGLRKSWYATVARGSSLYKAGADQWLSRREVHVFLNPPGDLSFDEALWQAVARSYTDNVGLALRIARSKIARASRQQFAFWREVARFFCGEPATLEEIDDLCDYLAARRDANVGYSLKGRTLVSLQRQMREWHRDLAAVARIEAARRRAFRAGSKGQEDTGRWQGSPLIDWSWQPTAKEARSRREEYVMTQLVTAAELVAEGRAMHHCVSTYARECLAGQASIWSLRRRNAGRFERLLTIELDRLNRVVQVRGFANRVATPEERQVVGRWAKARGVLLSW